MSQTRILCNVCGFPQIYCACNRSTTKPHDSTMNETPTEPKPLGPKITTIISCYGCALCVSESYHVQSDSGFDIYCTHGGGKKDIGNGSWNTPEWCPFRQPTPPPEAVRETAKSDMWNQLKIHFDAAIACGELADTDVTYIVDLAESVAKGCMSFETLALTSKLAEAREELAESRIGPVAMKLAESQVEAHELSHKLTAKTLEADGLRKALVNLEKVASLTAVMGASTGPHWTKLTVALLASRAALSAGEAGKL